MSPAPMSRPSSTNTTPLIGCIAATKSRRNPASATTAGSVENSVGSQGRATTTTRPSTMPAATPSSRSRRPDHPRVPGRTGAEVVADHRLTGDGQRIEGEGEQVPDLEGHLVRRHVVRAEPSWRPRWRAGTPPAAQPCAGRGRGRRRRVARAFGGGGRGARCGVARRRPPRSRRRRPTPTGPPPSRVRRPRCRSRGRRSTRARGPGSAPPSLRPPGVASGCPAALSGTRCRRAPSSSPAPRAG